MGKKKNIKIILNIIKVLKPETITFFNKKAEEILKMKNNKSTEENKRPNKWI